MKRNNLIKIFVTCLCLVFLTAGCSSNAGNQKPLENTNNNGTVNNGNTNNGTNNTTEPDRRIIADRISRMVKSIDGVKDATVLIADNTNDNNATVNSAGGTGNNVNANGTTNGNYGGNSTNDNANATGTMNNTTNTTANTNTNTTTNTNMNQKYVALIGVTLNDSIKADPIQESNAVQNIRKQVMDSEKNMEKVIVTTDENEVGRISDMANSILEGKTDANDMTGINSLRDDLMRAGRDTVQTTKDVAKDTVQTTKNVGKDVVNGTKDVGKDIANGVKDVVR